MSYEIDISSETTKNAADLENNQAEFVVDAATNTIKLIAKDSAGDAFTIPLGGGVKKYVANLTQTAGNAPVPTVLINNLSAAVVFSRTSAGLYVATLAGAFTVNKTVVRFGTPIPVDDIASIEAVLTDVNSITFKTKNYKTSDDTAGVLDGLLTNTAIMIEVYD